MIDAHCHSSSILVRTDAARAFRLMADGGRQGRWALGSWRRRQVDVNTFVGESMFTGAATWVRLHADPERLTVDYEVAASEGALRFRNAARVIDGPALGHPAGTAVVTLFTWRLADQSDDAWAQIGSTHETEMFLIRALLESGRDGEDDDDDDGEA
ncbi:hypothetical protein C7405_10223 [Paraburkholderia caballeronis]|uniref:hypothetical protein n=1 Tax=Paraburkholderia caballeronis TaxID=416943 RepID=UPI0010661F1D|nr:hypothetical protein [Paraburkholderia caballeronis]TDV37823.1 hypothetical protein C7405_10223 [Paraburkholderia caballeronis]